MKMIGIDVDALRKRYAELETELASINQVLAVVENTNLPGVTVTERSRAERHVQNSGLRRICLLQLFTGPCTVPEIARVTNQDEMLVKYCVRSCVTVGLANEGPQNGSKPGVFTLTEKGRAYAKWHQENPRAVVYAGPKL